MFKGYFLFISFILFANLSNGQDWVKQDIFSATSIEFPGQAERIDTMGLTGYRYISDSALYIVETRDIKGLMNVPVVLDSLRLFYDQVVEGIVERSRGRLIESKEFEIDGFKGLEIKIGNVSLLNLPDLQYYRIILKGSLFFSYIFWTNSQYNPVLVSRRTKYFNSIKLQAKSNGS